MNDNQPRAYDLSNPDELSRLLREIAGYVRASKFSHEGTDRLGREYAAVALYDAITKGYTLAKPPRKGD